ncbi:VAC7 [Candida theae]|uniref:VAC7 n=1 Tax=Candida theae TaxID=1198502 RepID=A0AAD5BDN9_9ASCO|nr:VAC7 [Candida theae]KAI5957679.1 VAC7 [Candida theae]
MSDDTHNEMKSEAHAHSATSVSQEAKDSSSLNGDKATVSTPNDKLKDRKVGSSPSKNTKNLEIATRGHHVLDQPTGENPPPNKAKKAAGDGKVHETGAMSTEARSSQISSASGPHRIGSSQSTLSSGSTTPSRPSHALQPNSQLSRSTINNINKTLKAKQKIIHATEPHSKSTTLNSNKGVKSPQSSVFPTISPGPSKIDLESSTQSIPTLMKNNGITSPTLNHKPGTKSTNDENAKHELARLPQPSLMSLPQSHAEGQSRQQSQPVLSSANFTLHPNVSNLNTSSSANLNERDSANKQAKQKKIAKQSSTKTDFFAAKLASAVDDVESSDSDETFVYENNDDTFDTTNNANQLNPADGVSTNGSVSGGYASHPGAKRPPSVLEADQLNDSKPHRLMSSKAPSIANSMNSQVHLDGHGLRRPVQGRALSGTSIGENAPRSPLHEGAASDRGSVQEMGLSHGDRNNRTVSVSHSANEDDTYSFQDSEGEVGRGASTEDDGLDKTHAIQGNSSVNQLLSQPYLQNLQAPGDPSTTPSISSKNVTKKEPKSSTNSSKLRSTTSKLFDKKGSQPRRYSTIPDDIDIEDFDDELIYYDNSVKFPHPNESSSLLNSSQRIPHYRSMNLNFPRTKGQSKRFLSTGQPLSPKDQTTNKEGAHIFPFPYNEQQHQDYYYDIDEFDHKQRYSPNFDLPELPMHKKASRNFSPVSYPYNNGAHNPLFINREPEKRSNCVRSFIYTLVCILVVLTFGFILGFVMATTKDLTAVSINSIENPIVSKDELVFNIVVEAFNPGWFSVEIGDVELDLFARSGYLPDEGGVDVQESDSKVETVKLGTIHFLESTMTFNGGFFSRESTVQKAEVKLLHPGKDVTEEGFRDDGGDESDNTKKWEIISENPFDLIITGVLKYDLPLVSNTKSVVVRKTGYIDPTLFI